MKLLSLISIAIALSSLQKRGIFDKAEHAVSITPLADGLEVAQNSVKKLERRPATSRPPTYTNHVLRGMSRKEKSIMKEEEMSELAHLISTGKIGDKDVFPESPIHDDYSPTAIYGRVSPPRQAGQHTNGFNPHWKLSSAQYSAMTRTPAQIQPSARRIQPPVEPINPPPAANIQRPQNLPRARVMNQPRLLVQPHDSPRGIATPRTPQYSERAARQSLDDSKISRSTLDAIKQLHIERMQTLKPIRTPVDPNPLRS